MSARVPQDVDLDDRLLFGLTATRFGELGVAVLAAFAAWRIVPAVGPAIAFVALAVGVVLGWGRWRGRPADHWAVVFVLFAIRTRRVEVRTELVKRLRTAAGRRRLTLPQTSFPRRFDRRAARQRLRVLDSPVE